MCLERIRILVVDDHRVVRQGLELFLSAEADFVVVGHAANGAEALEALERTAADVVLMDLVMPVLGGVEAMRAIRERWPHTELIAMTSFLDDRLVHDAIGAGASGYLLKDTAPDDLASAIRSVMDGKVILHPEAAKRLATELRTPSMREPLTPREAETLRLVAHGASNKDIALDMEISELTVKVYVSSLLSKLGVESRLQAAILAYREGLVDWSASSAHAPALV